MSEDTISRQAAIDEFEKELSAKYNQRELAIGFVGIKSILENLPSVERKKGEWLEREVPAETAIGDWQSAKCSACGKYHTTPYMYYFKDYNFCPHCGAWMGGKEE